ncbi:hypothetical protein AB8W28_13850 [Cronobacter universalis]|uniref:Uncharacterized protein n=2 Tax=Cronobacter universalis TaxID=535744 RepID=A0AAC8VTQ1_9ENTR|nr:hypothetical protein [Cronobacter universalis]ALB56673.1 hypothetical protein AFK65_19110 [Cronobacter universalis NCTC 9529]
MLPEIRTTLRKGLLLLILVIIPPVDMIFMETGTYGGGLSPLFVMVSLLFFNIFLWGLIIRLMKIWSWYKLIKGSVYYFCFLVIMIFSDVGYYSGYLAWYLVSHYSSAERFTEIESQIALLERLFFVSSTTVMALIISAALTCSPLINTPRC